MHIAFCSRNVWKCPACAEAVQRTEKDAHAAVCPAAEVACECGARVARSEMARHKAEACLMRTVECEFCEVSVPMVELSDHQEYCGSRTENCERCLQLVKLRDMDRHISSKCASLLHAARRAAQ